MKYFNTSELSESQPQENQGFCCILFFNLNRKEAFEQK